MRVFGFPRILEQDLGSGLIHRWTLRDLDQQLSSALYEIQSCYAATEQQFNNLMTSTEYMLNFLRFFIHDPIHLNWVNSFRINDTQKLVRQLEGIQRYVNLSEGKNAQSKRIEECFSDIFAAIIEGEEERKWRAMEMGRWRQRGCRFVPHITVQILQEFSSASQSSQQALCSELFRKSELHHIFSAGFRYYFAALVRFDRHIRGECDRIVETSSASPSREWRPFFRTLERFSSDTQREFMTRLRRIYVAGSTPLRDTVQELNNLFRTTNISQLVLSEVMTDTAIRSIIAILSMSRIEPTPTTEAHELNFLSACFLAINAPEHLREKEANCPDYKIYVMERNRCFREKKNHIQSRMEFLSVRRFCDGHGNQSPVLETTPGDPPSALWQKLWTVVSVNALIEGKEEDKCAVCYKDNVTRENFGVLDKCVHLFCAGCITTWFENKSTCPHCRAYISSWTTRDNFVAFRRTRVAP